uniref:VP2 n=1 Tax=Duck calicivirus TaxID=2212758 RepID=A0A3G1RP93_9CALI|nr:MAG: VP2 [Duck calicivirus]
MLQEPGQGEAWEITYLAMTLSTMANAAMLGVAGVQAGGGLISSIGNLVLGAQQLDVMRQQIGVQKAQIQLAYDQPKIDAESQKLQIASKFQALTDIGVSTQGAFEAVRGGRFMSGGRSIMPSQNTIYSFGGGVHNNGITFMPTVTKTKNSYNNNVGASNIPSYSTHYVTQNPTFRNPPPTVVQAWSDVSSVASLEWDYGGASRRGSVISNHSNNSIIRTPSPLGDAVEMPVWSGSIAIRGYGRPPLRKITESGV